jgi:hypothetical protein
MCADELFSSQAAPGFCSSGGKTFSSLQGIAAKTAAPIPASCSVSNGIRQRTGKLAKMMYSVLGVLAQALPAQENGSLDYAIIKLERPTGRAGLAYSTGDLLQAQDNVAVMGYPSGLPQKIASNAFVLSNDSSSPFFVANLDTFGSNSGSPVINTSTYQVEGILVRGTTDYVLSSEATCVQVNRCPEGGDANCAGENATKMAMLAERISESIASGSGIKLRIRAPHFVICLILVALARLKFSS